MKINKFTSVLIVFIHILALQANAREWQFALGAGAHVSDFSSCSATDCDGNAYFAGYITGGEFGGIPVPSQGVFLVKTNPEGEVQWLRTSGGGNSARQATGVACDSQNNIYVTGYFKYNISFGDFNLQGTIQPRMFMVKYNVDGEVLWAREFGTISDTRYTFANDLKVDPEDNIYTCGHFFGHLVFDNDTLTSLNLGSSFNYDIFLTKFSENGDVIWAQRAGGTLEDYVYTLAYDENGYIVLGGRFWSGGANFGDIIIDDNNPDRKDFVARFDTAGNAQWVKSGTPQYNSDSETTRLAVDHAGNIYAFGNYFGTVVFENDTLTSGQNFLMKMDADGNKIFTKSLSTNNFPDGNYLEGSWWIRMGDLAVDEENNLFLGTFFSNQFIFGLDTLVSDTSSYGFPGFDACVCKYNEIGFPQWVEKAGGIDHEYTRGISLFQNQIFINGYYNSLEAVFGNDTIYNNSGNMDEDIFIASIVDTLPNICPEIDASLWATQDVFCQGDSLQLTCEANYGSSFLWLCNDESIGFEYSHQRWIKEPGDYSVIVNPNTICSDTTGSLIVSMVPRPDVQLSALPDTVLCGDDSIQLQTPFSPDLAYQWFYNDTLIQGATGNTLTLNSAGWYSVAADNGICVVEDAIYIFSGATVADLEADPDTINCHGVPVFLSTPYDAGYQYIWYRDNVQLSNSNSWIATGVGGVYEVFVYKYGCFQTDQITLVEKFPPQIELETDTLVVVEFPDTINAGNEEANYLWFYENDSIPVSDTSVLIITKTGKYYIFASNACGTDYDSIFVTKGSAGINNGYENHFRFSVYPNPNNGSFELQSVTPVYGEISLLLVNALGKIIYETNLSDFANKPFTLSFPSLKQGIYFLEIKYGSNREAIKILVE
ncbi:MAG: T9SS type A sorting domain-containing protein [Bacteroidales bacterium]|nr:T9SS type A sorting domain-containing protein [Bacteroidales bacterium]